VPRRLNDADGPSAILRADDLAHQNGSSRPFSPEAETLQTPAQQQLVEAVRKAAEERKNGEPKDGDLEHPHAAKSIAQYAGEPTAERRDK
jgi:hypothetical protein